MTIRDLTARELIERARETLDARTRTDDDTQLIDAHDDLCNALELMPITDDIVTDWQCPDCGLVYEDNSEPCSYWNCGKHNYMSGRRSLKL